MADYHRKYKHEKKTVYVFKCGVCEEEFKRPVAKPEAVCPNHSCLTHGTYMELHWYRPKTEIKLFQLQEQIWENLDEELFEKYYLEMKKPEEDRDQELIYSHLKRYDPGIKKEFYDLLFSYTGSIFKKRLKNKGFTLPREEFEDRLQQAVFNFYNQYMSKPFRINGSWAGQIKWKITEALYSNPDDLHDSLNRMIGNSKDNRQSELIELSEEFDMKLCFHKKNYYDPYEQNNSLVREMVKVVKSIIQRAYYTEPLDQVLLLTIAFLNYIKKDYHKLEQLYDSYGMETKRRLSKLNLAVRRYLRNVNDE